jgi:hypothetical protein
MEIGDLLDGIWPAKAFWMLLFSGRNNFFHYFDNVSRQYDGVQSGTTRPGHVVYSGVP